MIANPALSNRLIILAVILITIAGISACKKDTIDPNSCSGTEDYRETYTLGSNYHDWFPVAIGDSVTYEDSLGNELKFMAITLDSAVHEDFWEDLTLECPQDSYVDWEEINLQLYNNSRNLNMSYNLSSYSQDHLTIKIGQKLVYIRIPYSDNLSYPNVQFLDSLDLFGKKFYNVLKSISTGAEETIYHTETQGVVGFRIIQSVDTLFYRLK